MKVALIVPTYEYNNPGHVYLAPSDFPVGLAYLAAALKKAGHEVIGVNVNNDPSYTSKRQMLFDKLAAMLAGNRPQLIGLGGLCSDYAFIKDALAYLRLHAPDIPIVCGGGIITHDAEFLFNTLRPDYCIIGEAEEALVKLVSHLETGSPALRDIPNVGFWENGKAEFTPESFAYPSLDTRAWPDYSPFDTETMLACSTHGARNLYRYSRPNPRIMPFVAARNCPFSCTFCVHGQGPRYSARPMEDIFAEIEHLYSTYRFNILIILDELFAIDKERLREFCNGIIERRETLGWDFDWLFQTHASVGLTLEDMKLAKKAGCYYFSYGIESASPRVLASMKKKIAPQQIEEAIKLAHEAGIGFGGNFIFGDIAETPETIAESMRFLTKNCLDILAYTTNISPYPGSLLFEYCLQQGLIKSKLEYYETIDRVCYNMTSMPDDAWVNWLHSLVWPMAGSFPWLVSTEPLEVTDEPPGEPFYPPAIRRVRANCPHCGKEQFYRQPIDDKAMAQGANFVTGCPDCGKRFRIQFNADGHQTGTILGRHVKIEDLERLIQHSIVPLASVKEHYDVLLITANPETWPSDPTRSYLAGMGLEEGLTANGLTFLSVPALCGVKPADRGTWLSHLKKQCNGKRFDQVWVDLVNIDLDDVALTYIGALAPVRVGLIDASLKFGELVFRVPPATKAIQRAVDKRLRSMTHILAADERDAQWLRHNKKTKVLWWIPALPERFIRAVENPSALLPACIANPGAAASDLPACPAADSEAQIAQIYNQTNEQIIQVLRSGSAYPDDLLQLHADTLRQLYGVALDARLATLSRHSAVAVMPDSPFTDAVRCLEGMAAGRPIIAGTTGKYPEAEALFSLAAGVLQYAPGTEGESAAQAQRLAGDSAMAADLAQRGRTAMQAHTSALRIHQILLWLDKGTEPDYRAAPAIQGQTQAATSPAPRQDGLASIIALARTAFERQDYDRAMLILERARREYPLDVGVANLHSDVKMLREEQVRNLIESIWHRENVNV